MNASSFSRSASVDETTLADERGVVAMSFTWSNFGVTDGAAVRAGDVFEGGLHRTEPAAVFETGPSLAFRNADPGSYSPSGDTLESSDTVTWVGEQQFTDRRPRVELVEESALGGGNGDSGGETTDSPTDPANASNGDMLVPVGALVVVISLAGARCGSPVRYPATTTRPDGAAEAVALLPILRRQTPNRPGSPTRNFSPTATASQAAGGQWRANEAGQHRRGD